jgi:rhomboid protease GluP
MAWPRAERLRRLGETPASLGLVALQLGVLALASLRLGDTTDVDVLVRAGGLERGLVWGGQWWRLLTAALLHVGWLHLGLNVAFGFGWMAAVERAVGRWRFLALWLLSALAGSAASLLAWDHVSAGASGALFGMIGAVLAIHRRLLGAWRPFLRSPATVQVAASLAIYVGVTVVGKIGVDHAAHAGGLVAGAFGAWAATTHPDRRRLAWGLVAGAVAVACLAAAWPRGHGELTAYQSESLERSAFAALQRHDAAQALQATDALEAGGERSPETRYLRGAALEEASRFEEAAPLLRALLPDLAADDPLRPPARRRLYRIGYRYYRGEGVTPDPQRGYSLILAACDAGDPQACAAERAIRTGSPDEPPVEGGR